MEEDAEEYTQPGGFAKLNIRQNVNVAPFPQRKPVTCEVILNADIRSEMNYEDEDKRRGDMAEDLFVKLGRQQDGLRVDYSKAKDDYESHIDFILVWPDHTCKTVDVKAKKKIRRHDEHTAFTTAGRNEELVWLELQGSYSRNKGWLSDGKADLVAFETEDSFLFFDREALNRAVRGKDSFIDFSARVTRPEDAENKIYPRGVLGKQGKCDEVTLVSLDRLKKEFPHTVFCTWFKNGDVVYNHKQR